jgi:hypothetical protein
MLFIISACGSALFLFTPFYETTYHCTMLMLASGRKSVQSFEILNFLDCYQVSYYFPKLGQEITWSGRHGQLVYTRIKNLSGQFLLRKV